MARRYRLAIVVSHPIQYDGPFFRFLARHPEIDLEVFYCTSKGSEAFFDEEFGVRLAWDRPLLDGYSYEFLPNRSPWPKTDSPFGLFNPAILERLRAERFDAVLVHGWGHATAWLAFWGACRTGTPLLLYGDSTLLTRRPRWLRGIKRLVLGALFQRVAAFLACGTFNAEFYQAHGVRASQIFLAPYAIDNDFFASRRRELLARRQEIRRQLGLPLDLPVILFSGKLVPRKRPGDLLRAFAGVRAEGLAAALAFVGEGKLRPVLEREVAAQGIPDVYFLGFRNQAEMPAIYTACDIVVLPSEADPRGTVTNEAMACGLPVIVSDRVGIWGAGDILRPGENGVVFRVGDIPALREHLAELVRDPELRQRMGERALQVISGWNYEARAAGILTALKAVGRK